MSFLPCRKHVTDKAMLRRAHALAVIHGAYQPGICRICGCTGKQCCVEKNGRRCRWANPEMTLCDSLDCLRYVGELVRRYI
jgi:hypothetical protein